MKPKQERTTLHNYAGWIPLALSIAAPLILFAPTLCFDRTLAFRDTASFYYPLFQWIEEETQRKELPLWNPHVNFGTPLVGEASSSVFYPGKLLLMLPLEFSWKFKWYVVGHVLLASVGGYYAARRCGLSPEAAALAAISYSCGGAVLFQYCNVVFLVGAAWLPLTLAAAETMLVELNWRAAIALGGVLAMMALGGDPQMAYHAGMAAAAYALAVWWSRSPRKIPHALQLGSLLAIAAVTSFVLSAAQTLPAAEASRWSERSSYHVPRNIYEAARVIASEKDGWSLASRGLFRPPEADTHAASIYEFSFAPWHLVEYVWPNASGTYFPQHRRWMMASPSEPRVWSPSVYLGLLPILLALASLRLRSRSRLPSGTSERSELRIQVPLGERNLRQQWLSWCALLAVLGSFGVFGVGWLLQQPLVMAGQEKLAIKLPSAQVGGVYWFCATFLPSYAYFRFPAKLLTFAAWPICLLAAVGLDRLRTEESPRLQRALLIVAAVSGVVLLALLLGRGAFDHLAKYIAPDTVYGPFDQPGCYRNLLLSLGHTLVLSGVLYGLMRRRQVALLVAATVIELMIANTPLIATAPSELWRERPLLAQVLEADRHERGDPSIRFTVRPPVEHDITDPSGWHASSSPRRIEDLAAADRHLMHLNHCLAGPVENVDSLTTQRLADYTYFYKHYHKNHESFWGNYWIMPRNLASIGSADENDPWEAIDSPELAETTRMKVFRHRDPFPRAWIVHDVMALPELQSRDPYLLSQRGEEVVERKIGPALAKRRDFRREAVLEGMFDEASLPRPTSAPSAPERCRVVVEEPNRVVVEVEMQQPGVVVLADAYFPGWTIDGAQVARANRIFRGVILGPGNHRLVYEYRPNSVYRGAWISACGWLVLIVLLVFDIAFATRSW